jgi:glycosyltransferase involved in cell wall biosynthesis
MKPLVSILIAAYNAEKWIEETIKSTLNQDWPNIEVIIVNDGSVDATCEIVKKIESGAVKVLSQENHGASAARNRAFSEAQGEYIQWLDADDILAPDKISRQLATAESGLTSLNLLSSAFGCFYRLPSQARFNSSLLWQDLTPVDWICNKFLEYSWLCPACWLVSRCLAERNGPWNERLSLDDDGEYFTRMVRHSKQVQFFPEAVNYHRIHLSGVSRQATETACNSLWISMNLCVDYLLALENSPRTRKAALKYLQDWYIYFYPEKKILLQQVTEKATALGGTLHPPTLDIEYKLVKPLVGWEGIKLIKSVVSDSKILLNTYLEKWRV